MNATRAFTLGGQAHTVLGHGPAFFALRTLVWCTGITAVFAPIAASRYRRG